MSENLEDMTREELKEEIERVRKSEEKYRDMERRKMKKVKRLEEQLEAVCKAVDIMIGGSFAVNVIGKDAEDIFNEARDYLYGGYSVEGGRYDDEGNLSEMYDHLIGHNQGLDDIEIIGEEEVNQVVEEEGSAEVGLHISAEVEKVTSIDVGELTLERQLRDAKNLVYAYLHIFSQHTYYDYVPGSIEFELQPVSTCEHQKIEKYSTDYDSVPPEEQKDRYHCLECQLYTYEEIEDVEEVLGDGVKELEYGVHELSDEESKG